VVTRVADYALQTSRPPLSVRLSDARSEWGSCNAKGEIRLNWRLVQLPPALAEYVVAHEVAHLDELNHSARFWSRVEALLPWPRGAASRARRVDSAARLNLRRWRRAD
jgi:predicted metal-dependent hydrolase